MMRWSEDSGIHLFTPEELSKIPDGTVLTSVTGRKCIKGKDYLAKDTIVGYTSYGVVDPWNHPLKDLFLVFKLVE